MTLPQLPMEVWLQILENTTDPSYLWTTLRHFSPWFESYINKLFLSTYLPKISASASLPRRDPSTNALRYPHFAPEITMHYSGVTRKETLTLATSEYTKAGVSIETLNTTGILSQRRLEEAVMWVSIGCSRAQAVPMDIPKTMSWDEERKIWVWEVEWKELVGRYFEVKRVKKEDLEKRRSTSSRRDLLREG